MKLFFSFLLTVISNALFAQYVGIGTTFPSFKLDVSGGSINTDSLYRIGGNAVLSIKGSANTFAGVNSGFSNTSGNSNTSIGFNSLYGNTDGNNNSAVGKDVLYNNVSGSYLAAVGYQALFSNTWGFANSVLGAQALYYNTTGTNNSAVGGWAMYNNTTGTGNSVLGTSAMYFNTAGSDNTAAGFTALGHNTTGNYNVANGYYALGANTAGLGNTGVGYIALNLSSASSYNTAIGYKAGFGFDHGWNNTFLGAESNAFGTGYFNSIAIGNVAAATASNQARIGNSSTTSIGGFTNWTNISDGRFKKNIHEDVKGLDFIMKLRPVTYQLDLSALSKQLNEQKSQSWNQGMQKALTEKEQMIQSGFIAQEVEYAAKELGYDFSGVDKPKNEKDLYGLRYAEFVVPLVKAVQEQQVILKLQQSQIDELRKIIEALRKN